MPFSSLTSAGRELHVQQRAAGFDVVHFAGRLEHGRRAVAVGALGGRNSFGQRHARLAAVGHGPGDRAEIDVAGRGQHFDAIMPALAVRPAVEFVDEHQERPDHDLVGIVVVVAVFVRAVQ